MKRVARTVGGFGLLVVGFILALPFVPGPGLALMAVGLVILSEEFPWAKRIVDWGKGKWHGLVAWYQARNRRRAAQPNKSNAA